MGGLRGAEQGAGFRVDVDVDVAVDVAVAGAELAINKGRREAMGGEHCEYRLHHENLDAYQAAIEFLALAMRIQSSLPRGYGALGEQTRRAALSIPLLPAC